MIRGLQLEWAHFTRGTEGGGLLWKVVSGRAVC